MKNAKSLKESCSDESFNVPFNNGGNIQSDDLSFNLTSKGLNFGHLNIQGICGKTCVNSRKLKQF